MRRRVFLDTGAIMALFDSRDRNHAASLVFKSEIRGQAKLLLTNYVLDELYTLGLKNVGYSQTVRMKRDIDALIEQKVIGMIWVTPLIAKTAWSIFEKYNVDKAWSFTDCVSFCVMKETDIKEVFTFDHHFTQMGFDQRPV